jgi:hypothetical protein
MDEKAFSYPKLHYFKSGNVFTGSYKGLNYKIDPKEDGLHIGIWYGPLCSALSEMAVETVLPLTDQGLSDSRQYLWEQYKLFLKQKNHK